MAPATTTTLRIPVELRDEVARIAAERGSTMVEVVADAVHRLGREHWWASVEHVLDGLTEDDLRRYHADSGVLDHVAGDGIDRG